MLDDVVRYVLDEVAMDGSIGTSPSRFIALFSRNSCPLNLANETEPPTGAADPSDPNAELQPVTQEQEQEREHYAAYVWRMMVDMKAMRVVLLGNPGKAKIGAVEGGAEDGGPADQQMADGQEDRLETIHPAGDFVLDPALALEAHVATPPPAATTEPAPIPEPADLEAEKYDLMLLKEKYGDKVVMRASEDEIMNALTGSYVRPSRLSNIVYTALQFIARGKEFGMSVLDIAKKTGQKPSTVFYLVKTLTDMGVVAKIKDTESNKTNIAVHRRYLNENFQYQLRMEHLAYLAEVAREDIKPDIHELEIEDNIPIDPSTGLPKFPPFGAESLGSRAFIKYRLIKLLKSDLWHHLIENRLLLKFMGFQPTYTLQARRQFQRHISSLKREGLIDEVLVPDENIPDKPHRCLRLAEFRPKDNEKETFEGALPDILSTVIDPALIDLEELDDDDLLEDDDPLDEPISPKELGYDYSYTIDHAVLQVVKGSGTQGVTIRQIMRQLNNLDHKTVDVVVARYERLEHHPTHLNDFLFKVTQEVYGREKRLRVFTLENFRQRCLEDGIQLNGEIPTHPNIGRYADLSDYKFCKTQTETKAALDFEWIGVPRACEEINKEHKKWTKRPPGMSRKPPKAKKGQVGQQDDLDPQVLGRPRKFIRTVGLDGKLVKRTKYNVVPVHRELPSVYLYNSETKVFFNVPADWDGVSPVQAPPDWDTAKEPICPIIPSTGLPALPELAKEVRKRLAAAEAKGNKSRKHPRDEDDDDHPAPPKKKGRAKKAADENATPPPPKKKGRARKSDKADPAQEGDRAATQSAVDGDQVDVVDPALESAGGTVATGKNTRARKSGKSPAVALVEAESPAAAATTRPAPKRRGGAKKKGTAATPEESQMVVDDSATPDVADVLPDLPTSTRAASRRRGKTGAAPIPADPLPASERRKGISKPTSTTSATGAMEVDGSADVAADESNRIESQPIDDAMDQSPPEKHALSEPEFELDPQLRAGITAPETAVVPKPALHLPGPVIAPAQDELAQAVTSPVAVTAATPATKKRSHPSNAKSTSSAADTAVPNGEPDPKKAKWTKLTKPRGSLQHPYRKREILEFIRAAGGVTTGGYFLCVNIWEWIQTHKNGKSTFENIPDKATMDRLTSSLEAEKEIKQISVAMNVHWGGSDRIPVVMLPDTLPEVVTAFINETKRTRQRATILPPQASEPGFTRTQGQPKILNRQPVRLTEQALEPLLTPISTLESLPAERVRGMFHQDWRLLAQSYGYIAGIFRRANCLHLEILKALQTHVEHLPNGDRVLQIDHLRREPSLRNICKMLPITVNEDELCQLLEDPEQADKPLHECPVPVQALIGVRRKTMRFKLARLLIALSDLGVLETGDLDVDDDRKPALFVPSSAFGASYIKIANRVPIYNYGIENPSPTLPLKMVSIATEHDLQEFWYAIWFLSLTKGDVNSAAIAQFADPSTVVVTEPVVVSPTLKRKLSTRSHWQSEYALQKAQRKYLDYIYETEPSSVVTDTERHKALSYRIFAPSETIAEYLGHLATRTTEKTADVRVHQSSTRVPTQQVRDAIAEKVRLRNERLETEWSQQVTLVLAQIGQQTSRELFAFLEPLHKQYLRNPRKYGPQQLMNAVTSFFARLDSVGIVRKRKGRITPHAPMGENVVRRARTKWTAQMEELARDAFVILEARKEALGMQNSGHNEALGQLFTTVDAFKVRTRVLKWRREHPANDAYLQRMQAAWKQVREEHADEIPDSHPDSFDEFDLMAHVDIFRKYVKKDQRVSSFFASMEKKDRMPSLPEDPENLSTAYDIQLRHKPMQVLDDAWAIYGDEKRDRALMSVSTVKPSLAAEPSMETEIAYKEAGLIDSVIKLIVANPLENFDEIKADRLLTPLNRPAVESHVKQLLQQGILTAYDKNNPKRAPGRAYLFQESYYRAFNVPISQDIQQDAEALLESVPEDEFVTWPVIAKEGEFASLLALVSEDMVDMHIDADAALDILDTKGFRRARIIDDDCIEVAVNLKLNEKGMQALDARATTHSLVWPSDTTIPSSLEEGSTQQRQTAKAREKVLLASALIAAVENAGKHGVSIGDLTEYFSETEPIVISAVEKALDNHKLILTGYSKPVIVHPAFKAEWQLSDEFPQPTQWLDIDGQVVDVSLQRSLRAVYGLLSQKPGINQHDLRQTLSPTFNRQELNYLLERLLQKGRISRIVPAGLAVSEKYLDLVDVKYEPLISYMPEALW